MAEPVRHRDYRKPDPGYLVKSVPKGPMPLPPPPPFRTDRVGPPTTVEEKKIAESSKSAQDKLIALHAYRRARGLCDKCVEKWSREYHCAATVQLQVMQEVLELFNTEESDNADVQSQCASEQVLLMSVHAFAGSEGPLTMQLQGHIQGLPLLILVGSGSSTTFLKQSVADKLTGVQPLSSNLQVQVANGSTMTCSAHLPADNWYIQDYCFQSSLKSIPPQQYDLIVGMDLLESFSPMKVDWKKKWMAIPFHDTTAFLQGQQPLLLRNIWSTFAVCLCLLMSLMCLYLTKVLNSWL